MSQTIKREAFLSPKKKQNTHKQCKKKEASYVLKTCFVFRYW